MQAPIVPQRSSFTTFLVYVVTFHGLWAAWPFLVYPRLRSVGEATLEYALLNLGCRLLVWVLPVFAYLRYVDRVDAFSYLKLRRHVARGIAVALVLAALNALGSMWRFGLPHLSAARVTWNSILGTSMLVGVIEEIPYRGFMLRKFAERIGFWRATLVTSLLFVGVHVPGWLALHTMKADLVVSIFVFGVVMALVFKYSESLWAPIITHSTNDFLSFVVFRL